MRMRKRLYKKRYKAALRDIAAKIPTAFTSRKDKEQWISVTTNVHMKAMKARRCHD